MAYLNGHEILFGVVGQVQYDPIYQGNLPLDFFSVGGNFSDWTIYGNSEGVGERTKNLVDITGYNKNHYSVLWYEDNGQLKASGTYSDSNAHTWPRFYLELSAGTYTLSGSPDYKQSGVQVQIGTCTDAQGSNFTLLGFDTGSGYTFTLQAGSWVSIRVYTAASLYQQTIDLTLPLMLRKADTTSDFIPYGYQVPLDIRSENNEKHMDIYIGDSPLTEGQSVSRDSTGIEIEVERGQNVIDTTLENKPKMSVVPDSYVKLKQIAMNSNGSYNETQSDFIIDNVEEVTQ